MILSNDCIDFVEKRYNLKYMDVDDAILEYNKLEDFAPDGNVWDHLDDRDTISEGAHLVMRLVTQYYLTKAFRGMKIDLNNPNVKEDIASGNLGTPGRMAKVFVGANLHDDSELGCGRWTPKPRIARFPNNYKMNVPITKRIDIVSNCSHHFIPFTTLSRPDSYAVISYVPDKYAIGISKLQRVADHISRRFFLQEDLTKALYDEICQVADTESVYIKLVNLTHGCESYRGSQTDDGSFTSTYYGGAFKDMTLRSQVDQLN